MITKEGKVEITSESIHIHNFHFDGKGDYREDLIKWILGRLKVELFVLPKIEFVMGDYNQFNGNIETKNKTA